MKGIQGVHKGKEVSYYCATRKAIEKNKNSVIPRWPRAAASLLTIVQTEYLK